MKNDLLNTLLVMQLDGPEMFTKESDRYIKKCVGRWLAVKKRRKIAKRKSQVERKGCASAIEAASVEDSALMEQDVAATPEEEDRRQEEHLQEEMLLGAMLCNDTDGDFVWPESDDESEDSGGESFWEFD